MLKPKRSPRWRVSFPPNRKNYTVCTVMKSVWRVLFVTILASTSAHAISADLSSLPENGLKSTPSPAAGFHLPTEIARSEMRESAHRVVSVPAHYGQLVMVVPGKNGTMLWFQSDKGTLRNVFVNEETVLHIQHQGTFVRK